MDKTTAIELLRVHVEVRWKDYAAVLPHAFLALLADQWQQVPLPNESDDPDAYVEALRALTRSLKPRAVAFVARGVGGSQHFYAAVEFPDDAVMRSLIWMIVDDALVSLGVMEHQPSDDADDEMRLFKPPPDASEASHINPPALRNIDDEQTEWKSLKTPAIRIIMEHQQRRTERDQ